jgi:hypothetical protein
MSADTSSRWNENQFLDEPWPGPEEHPVRFALTWSRGFGKTLQGELFKQTFNSFGTHIHLQVENLIEPLKNIGIALTDLNKQIEPLDRGNPPHWQAPHPRAFHFDRRGRKIY